MNAWIILMLAGLFEIGWPVGFKLAQVTGQKHYGIAMAICCMALSGWLLFIAQKSIPIGTAYAVWTGLGAAGTFLIGVIFFGDPLHWLRLLGVAMIVGGVVVLKTAGS
jgi:quaternary ammonium compound-resistance protein SugE